MRVKAFLALAVFCGVAGVSAAETAIPEAPGGHLERDNTANGNDGIEGAKSAARRQFDFETALLREMQRPVDWQLDGETVEALAARVRRELKVPVVIAWADMEDAGVGREDTITEKFEGLSVEQALETSLRRLHLVWTLSGKTIVFTSPEGAEDNLETRVYPVGDLLARGEFKQVNFDSLTDVITATVAADSWAENGGGAAEIRPFNSGGIRVLIISQTFAVHRKIAQLLQDIREARDAERANPSPAMSFDEFRELLIPLKSLDATNTDAFDKSDGEGRNRLTFLATTDGLRDVARRSNEFSLELMRRLTIDENENSVICGYSVREAMTLIALGASGESRRELIKALRLPESAQETAAESLSMRFHLSSNDGDKGEFSSANSLWIHSDLRANAEFVTLADKAMNAATRAVNFRKPKETAATINEWISERTHGKLKDVISSEDFGSVLIAAIVNATYFKGVWETPFDVAQTEIGNFTLANGEPAKVPLMHGKVFARFAKLSDSSLQIAELPYRGERMSALILLPGPGRNGLKNLEATLTAESLRSWLEALDAVELQLTMPKFKIRSRHELDPALTAMGLAKVFDLKAADLRRIVDAAMAIERVLQSALIEVDERGTEAAATTVVGAFGGIQETPLQTMVVDRPFLFLIRDVRSGCLLFVARVTDPADNLTLKSRIAAG